MKLLRVFLIQMVLMISIIECHGQSKAKFNADSLKFITQKKFDKIINNSICLLENKKLADISDSEHINIMMCLNTIFMTHIYTLKEKFKTGIYQKFYQLTEEKNYSGNIIKVYPEWIPNRGMGFYFPKLKMELQGTPRLYAWYQIKDE